MFLLTYLAGDPLTDETIAHDCFQHLNPSGDRRTMKLFFFRQGIGKMAFWVFGVGLASWIMLSASASTFAQDSKPEVPSNPIYVIRVIEVMPEDLASWRENVRAKQEKFNSAPDSSQWGTWRIATGPRTGQFARGFATTPELYSNPVHPSQGMAASWETEEAAYWLEHVQPLQESSGNRQIWRPIKGLRSEGLPQDKTPKYLRHRRWRMKPGMYQRLEANYKKRIAVMDHCGHPIDFSIARLSDGGDFMIYAETTAFNDMADIPGPEQIRDAFIAVHGEGSWEKYLEEHNAVMQENAIVETETWVYEESLSNLVMGPAPKSD
ncbi:MAG: hypothetical protein VYA84_12340 [Planctomycetota bacterium]|nr:hypothetical protein [Planctomycetota bacterium]